MKADTRLFGEIDIQDDKIITLNEGIIGFPDLQHFTLIFDEEKKEKARPGFQVSLLQYCCSAPVLRLFFWSVPALLLTCFLLI